MTESESVALPLGDTPTSISLMGWVVGFEPTYTGATTLGLNHLTIPTMSMLVNFVHCVVAVSLVLGYVHKYVPFGTRSTRLALRKIPCAYLDFKLCITALLRTISCACKFVNCVHYCTCSFKRVGDLERARTVDLQRDRLAF